MKRTQNIKMLSVAISVAILLCTAGSWIRPGSESAGLQLPDQLGYIIFPVLIAYMGVWNDKLRHGIRVGLVAIGHASFYSMLYLLIKRAGILMNIGEIDLAETISWATPLLYITIALGVVSNVIDLLYLAYIKKIN
ncbi:MAG: hypothetical protein IJT40_03300 [Firmicutes bacterium]|nr:hypothetical protein [Bacillota bacterium]